MSKGNKGIARANKERKRAEAQVRQAEFDAIMALPEPERTERLRERRIAQGWQK